MIIINIETLKQIENNLHIEYDNFNEIGFNSINNQFLISNVNKEQNCIKFISNRELYSYECTFKGYELSFINLDLKGIALIGIGKYAILHFYLNGQEKKQIFLNFNEEYKECLFFEEYNNYWVVCLLNEKHIKLIWFDKKLCIPSKTVQCVSFHIIDKIKSPCISCIIENGKYFAVLTRNSILYFDSIMKYQTERSFKEL